MDRKIKFNYRKGLVAIVTFLGGLYFFLEFILPARLLEAIGVAQYHENISNGFISVGAMALGLGLINLFIIHGSRILFKKKGSLNSFALLFGLSLMMSLSLYEWIAGLNSAKAADELRLLSQFARQIEKDLNSKRKDVPPADFRMLKLKESLDAYSSPCIASDISHSLKLISFCKEMKAQKAELDAIDMGRAENLQSVSEILSLMSASRAKFEAEKHKNSTLVRFFALLKEGFFISLGAAMFSLLGFYIAVAAYRAFRIRSFEAALMMLAALIVMLGQMSFASGVFEYFGEMRSWLMNTPNGAAFRAIRIGAAVAGLVLAFRMWFSIESESFSERS